MAVLEEDWSPFLTLKGVVESLDRVLEVPEVGYAVDEDVLSTFQNSPR
jgi:ubiquitin-protein ligase